MPEPVGTGCRLRWSLSKWLRSAPRMRKLDMLEQQLRWTQRRPDKAGWYWSKFINPQYPSHKAAITIMHVAVTHNRYRANGVPLDEICRYGTRLWAGPLTPPDAGDRED